MKSHELVMHILKDGQLVEKNITFDRDRLSYGEKLRLRERADIFEFAEIDPNNIGEGLKSLKNIKLKEWNVATMNVNLDLTKLLWGIKDINLDDVVAEDFDKMLLLTIEADVLDFKKEEDEAKKKKEEKLVAEVSST